MNRILFLALVVSLWACNGNNNSASTDTKTPVNKAAATVATPAKTKIKKDSTPPAQRQRYMVNKARPKNEVNAVFPYDIDLKTAKGEVMKSDELLKSNGKPTILLFWLTTCYPCRIELKAIEKKFAGWKEEADFNLFAISTDFEKNYENFVKRVDESKWPWQAYNDVNREFRLVMPGGLNGLPQTFVLDGNGEIVYHKRKYSTGDEDILFAKVKALAAK